MKTISEVKSEWPKLQVEFVGGKPSEILTVQQAAERFGMAESEFDWLNGHTAGTSINHAKRNNGDVYMVHRYTLDDSIRDAAPELLAMLKSVVTQSYEHERNHRGSEVLCSCSSIRINARKLLERFEA